MHSSTIEYWFSTALASQGYEYVAARNGILTAGREALVCLNEKAGAPEWQVRLTAEASIAWITEAEVCEKVTNLMRGNLPRDGPAKPITGEWPAGPRGMAIAALGRKATARVLEILMKSREFSNAAEEESLFVALACLKDPKAVPALIDLLRGQAETRTKTFSAHALGQIGDAQAVEPLLECLCNSKNDLQLRTTSATSLGILKEPRAMEPLLGILLDRTNARQLREEAVGALGALGHPGAGPRLAGQLAIEKDPEMLQEIFSALAEVGDRSCLPAIDRVAREHADELVREEAEAARAEILKRARM